MSIARVALFAALVQTVMANNVTTCSDDADCRQYSDLTSSCTSGACECTESTDTSDFCVGTTSLNDTASTRFVMSFDFACDTFFTTDTLSLTISTTVSETGASRTNVVTLSTVFSCGSTNAIVSGDVQLGDIASLADEISTATDAALVGTAMAGTRTATAITLTSADTCVSTSPVSQSVDVSGTCVAVACETGYYLTTAAPAYTTVCLETDDSDDDLSKGAIAAIVIGCVMGAVLIIGLVVLLVTGKKGPATQEQETKENEPADLTV